MDQTQRRFRPPRTLKKQRILGLMGRPRQIVIGKLEEIKSWAIQGKASNALAHSIFSEDRENCYITYGQKAELIMSLFLQPFKKYADFSGRASRTEYWSFYVPVVALHAVFGAGASYAFLHQKVDLFMILGLMFVLLAMATATPTLAVTIRRFHDRNSSAWCMMFGLLPVIGWLIFGALLVTGKGTFPVRASIGGLSGLGWLIFLVLLGSDGTPGPNEHGPDPRLHGE